jgi:pyruvate dehydrogenase E2 component (dihydrolipoamide acetyltransferase)
VWPRFNSSLSADGKSLLLKKYINLGIAVDTPEGLVVPVIRNVNKKSIMELSRELADISSKARAGKLTVAEMKGGCLTISSLGGIGSNSFTPIINAPEVAIVGLSKAEILPRWDGEKFIPRLMLPISLSYDHRVIDGAEGARFSAFLCKLLTDIRRIII